MFWESAELVGLVHGGVRRLNSMRAGNLWAGAVEDFGGFFID